MQVKFLPREAVTFISMIITFVVEYKVNKNHIEIPAWTFHEIPFV